MSIPTTILLTFLCYLSLVNARPLPKGTPCDSPGELGKNMFSSRVKRSLDYQLCKKAKGKELYCFKCICTWAFYYETAENCFKDDPEYKGRVKQEEADWDADSLTYCNRQAQKFSLDPKDPTWCGDGNNRQVATVLVLSVLLTLFLTW